MLLLACLLEVCTGQCVCIYTCCCIWVSHATLHHKLNFLHCFCRRALGVLIHEMFTGEPPFGYGGDDLPQRIVAGLPRTREAVAAVGKPDPVGREAESRDGLSEADGGLDQAPFLPIVRCRRGGVFCYFRDVKKMLLFCRYVRLLAICGNATIGYQPVAALRYKIYLQL